MYKCRQQLPYLASPIWPGEVVKDERLWVDVSETLSNIGANPRPGSSRHTHYSHEP